MDIDKISLFNNDSPIQENFQRFHVANTYWVDATEEPTIQQVQEAIQIFVKPSVVSPYQAKTALMYTGLYETVETMINASNNPILKIAWNSATEFNKNSPLIQALAQQLNLSEEQVDVLFLSASYIK